MIDMTIGLFSFLVYAFSFEFFFSSWSVSTKMSILHILILIGLTGIVALTAYLLPSKINPFIYIIVTLIAMSTIATHYEVPVKDMFFWIVILLATNFISEALALAIFRLLMSSTLFLSEYNIYHCHNQHFDDYRSLNDISTQVSIFQYLHISGIL